MGHRSQQNRAAPILTMIYTYFTFLLIIIIGHIEDLTNQVIRLSKNIFSFISRIAKAIFRTNQEINIRDKLISKYCNIPITTDFETFYIRRIYSRVKTCLNRIATGAPGKYIKLVMRPENYEETSTFIKNESTGIEPYKEDELNYILKYTPKKYKYTTNYDTLGAINLYENYKFNLKKRNTLIWDISEIKSHHIFYEPLFELNEDENSLIQTEALTKQLKRVLPQNINGISPINEITKRQNLLENCKISIEKNLKTKKVLNLGSYNYLGFGTTEKSKIKAALKALKIYPITVSAPTFQTGSLKPIIKLEKDISKFLKTEDTLLYSMGFGTNSMTLPLLLQEGTLVFSDDLNHRSIIFGTQMSKAVIKTFAHNDMKDLENKLRHYISQGQPETHREWNKVFVLVEGVYSMEGTIIRLDKLVELKRKYKFYIFVDEAHSIGVIGRRGKGVSRLFNKKLHESIDIFMGTFSKSFGGMGGYISGKKEVINFLKTNCDGPLYGEQIPPLIAAHVNFALKEISKKDCKVRKQLQKNTKFMRDALKSRGFVVYGDKRSPIIPLIIFHPGKFSEFSNKCLEKNIAIVVVGFPATSISTSRARICLSGCQTKKEIKKATKEIIKIGRKLGINVLK